MYGSRGVFILQHYCMNERDAQQLVLPFDSPDLRAGHPYLSKQLIAYLGNKRSLLGRLQSVFSALESRRRISVFLDPFAGSGSVSRLARLMGYRVLANDWEFYSYVVNACHLGTEKRETPELFAQRGGIQEVLRVLNDMDDPGEQGYISCFYAPQNTRTADYRKERLFYTAQNARIIDAVRNRIEELYPGFDIEATARKEKLLLLASLIYESATHTNTSGVFKAYHKGFGGHGNDALKRIMSRIELEVPVLVDSPCNAQVSCLDATEFAATHRADLCYLDPPYNQHQYGSNYHLLNTIALWDRPPVDNSLTQDGTLRDKAAIRRDWKKTHSPYCSRDKALSAFRRLLEAIDAPLIVMSYSTEGIIPFDVLLSELEQQGSVTLHTNDYIKYRGGKQSLRRQLYNMELLLVLDRQKASNRRQREAALELLARRKLAMLLKQSFYPERIAAAFRHTKHGMCFEAGPDTEIHMTMPFLYRFQAPLPSFAALSAASASMLRQQLAACECIDRQEELKVVVGILRGALSDRERELYTRRALWLLRKFAFRKYSDVFWAMLTWLRQLAEIEPERFGRLRRGLRELERLARRRFAG